MELSGIILVGCPAEVVFAAWADLPAAAALDGAILARRALTDGPVGVGTRYHAVDRWLRRRVEYVVEITAWEPPTRLAAIMGDPFAGGWDVILDEFDGSTELRFELTLTPRGLPTILEPVIRPWARRRVRSYLAAFRRSVEGGPATGDGRGRHGSEGGRRV